jgi:hypothetical protein
MRSSGVTLNVNNAAASSAVLRNHLGFVGETSANVSLLSPARTPA